MIIILSQTDVNGRDSRGLDPGDEKKHDTDQHKRRETTEPAVDKETQTHSDVSASLEHQQIREQLDEPIAKVF